ncbi:hypothetical protein IAT40_007906 [Kwoniella sp. CBS 6097]
MPLPMIDDDDAGGDISLSSSHSNASTASSSGMSSSWTDSQPSRPSFNGGAGPSRSNTQETIRPTLSSSLQDAEPIISVPAPQSQPQPQLNLQSQARSRPHSRDRDVSAPVPQRLFGKSLFTRSPVPNSESPPSSTSATLLGPSSSSNVFSGEMGRSVSLNDEPDVIRQQQQQLQQQATMVPVAGPSRSTIPEENAVDLTPIASSSTSSLGTISAAPQSPSPSPSFSANSISRPAYQTRRTSSSTLGRSRSLNVKLPSVSLDTSSSTINPSNRGNGLHRDNAPMSATSSRATPTSKIGWSRRPGEPRPPPLVSEATASKMNRWVKEVVVCNFDLERGPVVERRAGGRRWGPGEKENVAFSSFPDTSLFSEGSILFSFKIRQIPPDPHTLTQPEPPSPMPDRVVKTVEEEMLDLSVGDPPGEAEVLPGGGNGSTSALATSTSGPIKAGDKAEEYRRWDERGREWLYGFVWFEQRRDKGITRGYMQKSLVILTHLPFPALFSSVLQKVAPVFFEYGYSALEAACHSIAAWPDPSSDSVLELPMMTDLLTVKLPDTTESPQIGRAFGISSPTIREPLLASLPTSTPLRAFASFLPSLWSLWECLILAEPVLVIAPDPKTCSEIVWWLREMLRPIPPAGDFRPYLHIHDHDFSLLVNSNKPQAGVVVGVTNPFFRNAASHWPNVISIPAQRPRRIVPNGTSPAVAPSPVMKDTPEGFLSRRHRSVQKDRPLLKRLETLAAEGNLDDPEGNEALRTHFQQLTERFLVPLNRYFQTLVPTLSTSPNPSPVPSPVISHSTPSTSTTHTAGAIRPFSLPAFLSHLRNHGPNPLAFKTKGLSTKSRVENDFYASFCMSPTFARWLEARVDSLGLALNAHSANGAAGGGPSGGLTVPGHLQCHRSPHGGGRPDMPTRPSLPRSASASVGLGILGSHLINADGRSSPTPLAGGSESEFSRMSSETDSLRFSEDSERIGGGSGGVGGIGDGSGREPREREGSGATIVPPAGWYDGRRASEGMVKAYGRGSIGR